MGRARRFQIPGVPQLVSQRGHNRLPCFTDQDDFQLFTSALAESADLHGCRIRARLLLPDSYWLVLKPDSSNAIPRTIQRTGRLYVRHINRKYRRVGTLWAERYRACPIEPSKQYLGMIGQFLADLPHRRGVAKSSQQWPWYESSLPIAGDDTIDPDYDYIESLLRSGFVFGSANYRARLEKTLGQQTAPRQRGRPPKQ